MQELQREKIYDYIIEKITSGEFLPGAALDLNKISKDLAISKTPLRDALIKLEAEGFLNIHPRSKVLITQLSFEDICFLFETIAALESMVVAKGIGHYPKRTIKRMRRLDEQMRLALENDDFTLYKKFHAEFHAIFLVVSPNNCVERLLDPIKKRLWGMPLRRIPKQWLFEACDEHCELIQAIEDQNTQAAIDCIKQKHWNYEYHAHFIKKAYFA